MKRFCDKNIKQRPYRWILSISGTLLVCILFSQALDIFSEQIRTEQKTTLENAIQMGIAQCYAAEGRYPQNLEELKDDYGIQYDNDTFFVDYQIMGANIAPDVTIIERK